MTVTSHIAELKKKHDSLSETVDRAQRSPGIDGLRIAELKKQKMKLKEEIGRLSS
ncbi:YdcH family protein [Cypionkella sp.]|uniref:YdcH family protein n=1 Tax=Cypionkella sp. TaxID=2811411 RepID=UPI002FDDDABB